MLEDGVKDTEEIVRIVVEEGGVEQAMEVANKHASNAMQAIETWKASVYKEELYEIVDLCLTRKM